MNTTSAKSSPSTGGQCKAARTAVVGALAASLLLGGGAVAANALVPVSTTASAAAISTTATPSPDAPAAGTPRLHGRPAARLALRFFINGDSSNPGYGQRAVKVAELILDRHPKAAEKLPEALQADLKSLKNAADGDRVAAATKIKDSALNGGYGEKIQKLAQQIQNHKAAGK